MPSLPLSSKPFHFPGRRLVQALTPLRPAVSRSSVYALTSSPATTPITPSIPRLLPQCYHTYPPLSQGSSWNASAASHESSINSSEVSHFTALAASWWDPHGPSRLLHLMNPLRHDFISSCLQSEPLPSQSVSTRPETSYTGHDEGLRYLDIGCGGGIFAESAARLQSVSQVLAIDPSAACISVASSHARSDPFLSASGSNRLEYINTGIESLTPGTHGLFDVVTLFEVIEHVDTPSAFLSQCVQFVKPGGWFICSTVARTWTSWLTTKVMAEDVLGIVPRGTHAWEKYVDVVEMEDWFRKREAKANGEQWGGFRAMGTVYVPGLGWKVVPGGEKWGNYFFGARRR